MALDYGVLPLCGEVLQPIPEIASLFRVSEKTIRRVI